MKYWIGFTILVVLFTGMLAFILIDNLTGVKSLSMSKDNIIFLIADINDDKIIFSGRNWDNEFTNYTLEIKTKNNEIFANPKLSKSSNVTILQYSEQNSLISVNFYVTSGTKISFELSSNNFETGSQTFLVTPFGNTLEINFTNLYNKLDTLYSLQTETVENKEMSILYFVEDFNNFNKAVEDEYPCVLNYSVFVNRLLTENCIATSSKKNILEVDLSSKTIVAKGTGTASIAFEVLNETQEQRVMETMNFIIKLVPVEKINNLDEEIKIKLTISAFYNFEYELIPHYSKNFDIVLSDDSANDVISFNKTQIIGLKSGEVQINFIVNQNLYKTITVKVTNQIFPKPDPNIEYSLEISLVTVNNSLNFDAENNILYINLNEINALEEPFYFRFEISLNDKNGNPADPLFNLTLTDDSNNILVGLPEMNNLGHICDMFFCIKSDVAGIITTLINHTELEVELNLTISCFR